MPNVGTLLDILKVKDDQGRWIIIPALMGPRGSDGNDGITPTVSVTNISGGHNVSFYYGSGDSRNRNFNIMDGTDGTNGVDGTDGETPLVDVTSISGGHLISFSYGPGDSRNKTFYVMDGTNGTNGTNGTDGITPTVTITPITGGNNVAFYYGSGDSRNKNFNVLNGTNGTNGTDGDDGITPTVTVTTISGGHNVAFSYGAGDPRNTNFDVLDGLPGEVPAAAIAGTQASTTASKALAVGEHFWLNGTLYTATSPIASGGTIVTTGSGKNCDLAVIGDELTSQSEKIDEVMIYKGNPTADQVIFTSENVSVGEVVYYDFELSSGSGITNCIELLDASDQRLGLIGKTASSTGGLKYFGAFIVPQNFAKAVFKTNSSAVTSVNYITKYLPERYSRNLIDPINYMPAYTKVGTGLKTDGTTRTAGGTSSMAVTDFIPVLPGDLITTNEFMGSNTYGLCFYDLKQTYISGLPTKVNVMSLIVPDGAFYVRYTVNKNQTQVINIFRGDELKVKCGNLFGKKAVTFGDSITWYDGQQFTWGKFEGKWCVGYQSYMRRVGMVVTNVGVSGDDITEINEDIRATTYTNYDYATITSGVNDTIANLPVGTIAPIGSTFDTTTFYGALQDSIEYILGQKETIKIVLITPIKGTIYPDTPINPLYVKAFKDVGELYGLPVCDWYNTSGINELTYGEYINDPDENNELYWVHPTNAGFKRMADILVPFLKNLEVETIPHAFP